MPTATIVSREETAVTFYAKVVNGGATIKVRPFETFKSGLTPSQNVTAYLQGGDSKTLRKGVDFPNWYDLRDIQLDTTSPYGTLRNLRTPKNFTQHYGSFLLNHEGYAAAGGVAIYKMGVVVEFDYDTDGGMEFAWGAPIIAPSQVIKARVGQKSASLLGLQAPNIPGNTPTEPNKVSATWGFSSGNPTWTATTPLPTGVSLDKASGKLNFSESTKKGTYTVSFKCENFVGESAPRTVSIDILEGFATIKSLQSFVFAKGDLSEASVELSDATNRPASSWAASGLPAGLQINSTTGKITGRPTQADNSTAKIITQNAAGKSEGTVEFRVIEPIVVSNLTKNATGQPQSPDITVFPSNRPFTITYDGKPTAPKDVGSYQVGIQCAANKGFDAASRTETFKIVLGKPTVKWSGLNQPVGLVEAPVVTTTPAGLSYKLTYDGNKKLPDTPGAYTVRVSIPETELASSAQYSESFVVYTPGGRESSTVVSDGSIFVGGINSDIGGGLVVLAKDKPFARPPSFEYQVYGPANLAKVVLPRGINFSVTRINDDDGFVQLSGKESGTPSEIEIREVETILTGRSAPPNQEKQFTYTRYQLYVVTDKPPSIVANQSFTVASFDKEVNIPVYLNDIVDRPAVAYTVKNLPPGLRLETHLRYIDSFAYTIDPSTDTVFAPGSQLSNGQRLLRFQASDEPVYVRDVAGDRFKVSETPGGPAINFTRARKETLQVEVQSWFPLLRGKPTKGGTYSVELTASNPVGSDKKTFTIQIPSAKPKITFGATSLPFNGKAQSLPYTITPENAKHTVTYNGSTTRPTNIGTYEVVVTVPEGNDGTQFVEAATAKTTFQITKATPVISFRQTTQQYDDWRFGTGSSMPVKGVIATSNSNAPIVITYDGKSQIPEEVGKYKVVAKISGTSNYEAATAETTFTIVRRKVRLEFDENTLEFEEGYNPVKVFVEVYKSTDKDEIVSYRDSLDAPIQITYDGSATPPTQAGEYNVTAKVEGSKKVENATATATLRIKGDPLFLLDQKNAVFAQISKYQQVVFGTGIVPNRGLNEIGFTINAINFGEHAVEISHSFSFRPLRTENFVMVSAGLSGYRVLGSDTFVSAMEFATRRATLLGSLPPNTVNDNPLNTSWWATPSLPLKSITLLKSTLLNWVRHIQFYYNPINSSRFIKFDSVAGSVCAAQLEFGKVSVDSQNITYGLPVGDPIVRVQVSSNPNQLLQLSKIPWDSKVQFNTGFAVRYTGETVSYDSNVAPTEPGVYTMLVFAFWRGAVVNDVPQPNGCGWAAGSLTIVKEKTVPTVTIELAGSRTFTGKPQVVRVITTPANLANTVTYNGATQAPTDAGTYKVVVTVPETEFTKPAKAETTLTITKAIATISFSNTKRQYTGTALGLTVTTTPPGLNHIISYDGVQNELPINVGTHAVQVAINDKNYSGSASATFEITPGAPRIKPNQVFTFRPGSPVTVQLVADDSFNRPVTMWQVKSTTAMPAGLKFDTRTGVFSGRIDAFGTIALTIVATGPGGTDEKAVTFRAEPAAVFMGKSPIKSLGDVQKLYYGNIQLYP